MSRGNWTFLVLGWCLCALVIAGIIGQANLFAYYRLKEGASIVVGRVVERHPESHDSAVAEFEVNGRSFRKVSSFIGSPNPPMSSLKVGAPVTVFYLPSDPSVAALGDPRSLIPNELTSVLVVSLIFPTLIIAALVLRRR